MELFEVPLRSDVLEVIRKRGITRFNPIQEEAIKSGLLDGERLLIASPTASGKTLIAEIATVNSILNRGGKAVYVTPLRALTLEKYRTLKDWESIGLSVAMTSGDYDTDDAWLRNYDIIVTTYEKLDSLWRHKPKWIDNVKFFVLDEVHYMNDPSRGPIIEGVVIRAKKRNFLALSATVSNYDEIANWLQCKPIALNWRPVPLREGVLFQVKGKVIAKMSDGKIVEMKGRDPIIAYTKKIVDEEGQVLIFRNSRRNAEQTAYKIAESLGIEQRDLGEEVLEIEDSSTSERKQLAELVERGVAYHHAGLSRGLREFIESSFLTGKIKVISATPTLAAGVNLPARAVIVADIYRYNRKVLGYQEEIPVMEYKQMSGRAGRPGFDAIGESLILVRNEKAVQKIFEKYILAKPEPLTSKMANERSFYSFILGTLAIEGELNRDELMEYLSQSLVSRKYIESNFNSAIEWLEENQFLTGEYRLTDFGRKVADLYVNPFTAKVIKDGLEKGKEPCTFAYLHLLASTPDAPLISASISDEFLDFPCELYLDEPEDELEALDFASALKIASIVEDWISEVDEDKIIESYSIGSGDLRAIVETMEWLTYSASKIASVIGLKEHAKELEVLALRVAEGVNEELIPLVKIKNVGRKRARILYHYGIRTSEDIVKKQEIVKKILGEKVGEKIIESASQIDS
ncbi:DEAD/DEAH box helicase [Sulfolobales archaeon HS-7]|nr:DEAD/DEAH box helicase [Sulfolobales archaeon HS-7]